MSINTDAKKHAGLVEEEMKQLGRDMTTMALGALATRGILVSDRARTELQLVLYQHVTQSVEIEAAVVAMIEGEHGPQAA